MVAATRQASAAAAGGYGRISRARCRWRAGRLGPNGRYTVGVCHMLLVQTGLLSQYLQGSEWLSSSSRQDLASTIPAIAHTVHVMYDVPWATVGKAKQKYKGMCV